MLTRFACAFALTMLIAASGAGQATLTEGERVRVHRRAGSVVTGSVELASPLAIRLRGAKGAIISIPRDSVAKLERSLGKHRRLARDLGLTVLVVGAGVGVVSAISWSPCNETGLMACFMSPGSAGEAFAWGAAYGGVIGVPIGLIVGLTSRHERWEPLAVGARTGPALAIRPILGRQVGLSASIVFGSP